MVRRKNAFRRDVGSRTPKQKFYLICEGKNTEPYYFKKLGREPSFSLVEIIPEGGAGVPESIAAKAIDAVKRFGLVGRSGRRKDSFEKNDEVWAVFDRDEHPKFQESIIKCEANGIGVAWSDPCFELWLVLHFEDFDKPDGRKQVQKHLEKLCPNYTSETRKIADIENIISSLEAAEKRAKTLISRRLEEGGLPSPASTSVFKLTLALRGKR